ncbi:hypothetical protein [Ignicoccus hospitalis]|uniref:Uncharacterized protein n=1 Tax=Ignicoccus hospitalis (strain KIN4/I / DSM 18386 / JCM 14125) TaxID=453591 RepID=A8ABE7_IGNH4|nr:hypothetical protein [Ignicoccus hospitalis]ABU82249.1 hypothetical protein Igni_1072 [Ignicoccus hospitalis KIN4/I]HIH90832.1 hypothetical protein [Desulfurococcaceae archaeon]
MPLEEMVARVRDLLGDEALKLVKRGDVFVTAFHHFASVAATAAKLCALLEEKGYLPEGSWEECFWAGAVHDYEKLGVSGEYLRNVAKESGIEERRLEELAARAEAGLRGLAQGALNLVDC